jgi:hypothetical protein
MQSAWIKASVATLIFLGGAILTTIAPGQSQMPSPVALAAHLPAVLGPMGLPGFSSVPGPGASSKSLFLEAGKIRVPGSPYSVAVGDFNNDGKPDFAVAGNNGQGAVDVYLGNGDGTFRHSFHYMTENHQYGIAAGDFNGDGKQDLAVLTQEDHGVAVFLGNGDGTFQNGVEYFTSVTSIGLIVADLNGDGKLDIATVNLGGAAWGTSILFGRGDGTFKKVVRLVKGGGGSGIAVGDFNHDGNLDLAETTDTDQGLVLSIFLGTGGGNFAPPTYYPTGQGADGIAVADLNGDGKLDLITGNECDSQTCSYGDSPGSVSVLLGNGDGTFQSHVDYPTGLASTSVAVGDFNGDGKPDLVVGNYDALTVSVLLGNGDGTFRPRIDYGTAKDTSSVAVADFNGDGLDDIIATNGHSSISILLANSTGGFHARADYVAGANPLSVVAKDFNGDGNIDLAVAAQTDNAVSVLLGDGNGAFKSAIEYPVGYNPTFVKSGDLNHDGNLDLAVLACPIQYCQGPESVYILLGKGDGTFQPATSYAVEFGAGFLAIGDFNNDGNPDIAVVNDCGDSACNGEQSTVSILIGNGDGTFQSQKQYDVGYGAQSVVAADFNGDGNLDLAVTNYCGNAYCYKVTQGSISILLGNGDGTFKSQLTDAVEDAPRALAVGDLNGDGVPDLVLSECPSSTCQYGQGLVSVLLGKGDGTFSTERTFLAPETITDLKVAELNGDSIPDVAASVSMSNTVAVFLGKGNGNLLPYVSYQVGYYPESLTAADVNNDGKFDLIVANWGSGDTVSVLLNTGQPTGKPAAPKAALFGPSR